MPAPAGRRLTTRGRERRQQILDFAIERFADQGYHATSISDIVDGLGVGKGVFYWYFASKDALMVEILDEAQRSFTEAFRAAADGADGSVERLAAAIRCTVEWQANHRQVATIRQFAAGEARFADVMRRNHEATVAEWVTLISAGADEGTVVRDHPVMLANAIVGITTSFDRVFIRRGTDPETVAEVAVRFCIDGIAQHAPSEPVTAS